MNTKVFSTISIAVLLAAGCGNNEQAEVVEEVTPVVSVARSCMQEVPQTSVYSSNVQAYVVNQIAPQTGGRIQKLNVEVGDFVNAGQILAEMDKVQLVQSELRLNNDRQELDRVKSLLAEGAISQSDFDGLELAFKVSEASYNNLLENTILRAPVSGVISARNYDRGDLYGMSAPIYVLQQITPVKLLVAVSESDYSKVKKGDKVTLTADALPGMTFTGDIARVYPVVDPSTHTVNVEVQVPNKNRVLRPGMYSKVTMNFGNNMSVVVPDVAVQKLQGSGQRMVYVVTPDNTVDIKNVTIGRHFGNMYEILSGLSENEMVITQGHSILKAGIKVEVAK